MNRIKQLQETIAKAQAELESLKRNGKRWRANKGEDYYTIDFQYLCVDAMTEDYSPVDNDLYVVGNYFSTEAEGKHNLKRMIATQQIKDRIAELNSEQGWVPHWRVRSQTKFFPSFNHSTNEIVSKSAWLDTVAPIEFACSQETLVRLIEDMPDQIKLWLGVE